MSQKKRGQVRTKICDDSRDPFIATLHNIILAPYLCDKVFSIIALINSGSPCLFNNGFSMVYFRKKEKNAVTLPHSAERKHAFLGK